jgi:hypothetical protein
MAKKKLRYITVLVAEETYQALKKQRGKRTLASTVRELLLAALNMGAK